MKQHANMMLRVPKEVHQWLVSISEQNHRSMNSQATVIFLEEMKRLNETSPSNQPTKANEG